MAETRFIKTVAFGGYDKAEVVRRLEYLNSQVYELRNELRETKLLLEAYKKGTDVEKAHEAVLAGERTKLTQLQVQNDTLNTKLKASDEENRGYGQKLKDAEDTIQELKDQLKETAGKLSAMETNNEAMSLSSVFIEAQKSAAMLEGTARSKSAELTESAKKVAADTIEEANVEAAQIIYEAERSAAETIAEAKNKSEQMDAASNNLRAVALDEVYNLKTQVDELKNVLEAFRDNGLERLSSAQQMLDKTESTLKDGGVPVFRAPVNFEPELPEEPMSLSDKIKENAQNEEEKLKKKNELDKLKQMAESIGGKKESTVPEPAEEKKSDNSLADIAAKAAKLSGQNTDTEHKETKGGKIDLAALAAKASALGKK